MSGFFGIFRPQGGPVDLEAFEQMKTAMQRGGFDGMETHVEEKIAMGHLMLRVSPESKYDKQPLKSSCGNYILVGHFRLDYRDELGDKLGLTQSELEQTPDSQLVMLAYLKWKKKCVHHLEGDWAFALYDNVGNSLCLFRDQVGYSALYFTTKNDELFFASDLIGINAVKKISLIIDFKQLLRISLNAVMPEIGKTLFAGCYALQHGNLILFDFKLTVKLNQYWSLKKPRQIRFKDQSEYGWLLFHKFHMSVKTRYNPTSSVGLFLSSGYDSTAVAYVLNALASSKIKSPKIFSYTSVPTHLSKFSEAQRKYFNEGPYVQDFITNLKNFNSKICDFSITENIDFFTPCKDDFYYPISSPNTYWIDGIYNEAKRDGIKILFNGQMGNFTLTNKFSQYLYVYLVEFRLKRFFFELNAIRKQKNKSIHNVLSEFVFPEFKWYLKSLFHVSIFYLKNNLVIDSIFNISLFKKYKVFDELKNEYFLNGKQHRLNDFAHRSNMINIVTNSVSANWYHYTCKYGVESLDPTNDLRLIMFSFSIPCEMFNLGGEKSAVFKMAFDGKIPNDILDFDFKRPQAIDIVYRLKDSKKFLEIAERQIKNCDNFRKGIRISNLSKLLHEMNDPKSAKNGYNLSRKALKDLSILEFVSLFNQKTG